MPHDNRQERREQGRDANRDPITGEPGAHPIGTGAGAAAGGAAGIAGGAAAGAATGTAAGGPVGAAAGAVVGGVAGAVGGKAIAEKINPTDVRESSEQPGRRNLDRLINYEVYDRNESKIGTLKCLWADHTGEPAFIGVHTGWIFGKTHVVPAREVHVNEHLRRLRLPYSEEQVKNAPAYDEDAEISPDQEQEVHRYYGVAAARKPADTARESDQATIQLSEEEIKIGKRQVEAGGVRLRKVVRTEVVNQPVEVQREEVVIERVPPGEAHATAEQAFQPQDVYIPLRREEIVVQKEAHIREEVRARKRTETEKQEISERVRKEDLEVEETGEARRTRSGPKTPAEEMAEREGRPRSQRRRER